ncbi:MAG: site-specific integrase [Pseudomonadota bacterium]
MDRFVTPPRSTLAEVTLEKALQSAKRYANKSRSDATWRAYKSDWRQFEGWCADVGLPCLPAEPETIAMFVASQADKGLNPTTINRRLAALRLVHLGAGHDSPHNSIKVTEVMRGIRRNWGQPPKKKSAVMDDDVKRMADAVESETRKGLRDRALVLLGFAGAFRRSELVGLNTWNLVEQDEGLKVTIEKSKTDQEAIGQTIGILRVADSPYCPVRAVSDWLTVAGIESGPVFRRMFRGDKVGQSRLSSQSVALVIKELAFKAGLDADSFSGHSLRSGFLTSAARTKANLFKMADQSRHKSLDMLQEYVRHEDLFENNAGAGLLDE